MPEKKAVVMNRKQLQIFFLASSAKGKVKQNIVFHGDWGYSPSPGVGGPTGRVDRWLAVHLFRCVSIFF